MIGQNNLILALGHGFLEKVYENALVIKLKQIGLTFAQQAPVKVYKATGINVGVLVNFGEKLKIVRRVF